MKTIFYSKNEKKYAFFKAGFPLGPKNISRIEDKSSGRRPKPKKPARKPKKTSQITVPQGKWLVSYPELPTT